MADRRDKLIKGFMAKNDVKRSPVTSPDQVDRANNWKRRNMRKYPPGKYPRSGISDDRSQNI